MVNIRRMQQELDSHPTSNSPLISRAEVEAILNSARQSELKSALQSVLDSGDQFIQKSTIQSVLNSTSQPVLNSTSQPEPQSTSQPEPQSTSQPPDTRPIWPGRPELIYQAYLTEKEAWLSDHPTVRPSNYRTIRGYESHSIRYCKEQARFLPIERLDLKTETLIEGRPHWTTEEILAWLDYKAIKDQEVERQVEAELVAVGGFGRSSERGIQGLWSQIRSNIEADAAQYRFTN